MKNFIIGIFFISMLQAESLPCDCRPIGGSAYGQEWPLYESIKPITKYINL